MISQPPHSTILQASREFLAAFAAVVRNRRAMRMLDAAQLEDAGITSEMLREATDWRFWRRIGLVDVSARPAIPVVAAPREVLDGEVGPATVGAVKRRAISVRTSRYPQVTTLQRA